MGLLIIVMFNKWELILCLFYLNLWREKARLVQSHVLRHSQFILCYRLGFFAHPMLPPPCGTNRQEQVSMMGKSSCFQIISWGNTSRVSQPAPGPLPHGRWRIKELGEKVKQKKAPGKDGFYVHLQWKKIKVHSMKINVSQKIRPCEPVCSIVVIIWELPNGSHKIRRGCREGPPRER